MDRPPIEANTLDHVLRTDSIEDVRTCETSIAFSFDMIQEGSLEIRK